MRESSLAKTEGCQDTKVQWHVSAQCLTYIALKWQCSNVIILLFSAILFKYKFAPELSDVTRKSI